MTKDEALRLALKAMKVNNSAWKHLADSGDAGYWEAEEQECYQLNEQAIKAVEAALEAKDEPVAWISPTELLVMRGNALGGAKDWRVNVGLKPEDGDVGLYTTPPQRTWVGLTDEEVKNFVQAVWPREATPTDYIRAIEAQLKEKNS